ncbi:glycosyltransferase [Candidatus Dojkabacteria bacterium]|uniref:Glycosyltransferase n=1 Tax=Candidatus Dojkabacteria bacterium TaxID=2099670 RepID=A0A955L533_9BACT|nr:glycosyltransferase [Candidatus Dojkabacteria bacterium]
MKKVNVIVPSYNEAGRIERTLEEYAMFVRSMKTKYDLYLYVVNDGSKDQTAKIVKDELARLNVASELLNLEINHGKGYALKYGVFNSRKADYYYLADADLSAKWNVLADFLELAEKEDYDVVIASRGLETSEVSTKVYKRLLGRSAALVIQLLLGLDIQDTQCGYKLFKGKTLPAFKELTIDRWGFDFELLYLVDKMGFSIGEVGIKWVNKSGSKVKLSDYPKQLIELLKVRIKH